jgi:hypothetical protein
VGAVLICGAARVCAAPSAPRNKNRRTRACCTHSGARCGRTYARPHRTHHLMSFALARFAVGGVHGDMLLLVSVSVDSHKLGGWIGVRAWDGWAEEARETFILRFSKAVGSRNMTLSPTCRHPRQRRRRWHQHGSWIISVRQPVRAGSSGPSLAGGRATETRYCAVEGKVDRRTRMRR